MKLSQPSQCLNALNLDRVLHKKMLRIPQSFEAFTEVDLHLNWPCYKNHMKHTVARYEAKYFLGFQLHQRCEFKKLQDMNQTAIIENNSIAEMEGRTKWRKCTLTGHICYVLLMLCNR